MTSVGRSRRCPRRRRRPAAPWRTRSLAFRHAIDEPRRVLAASSSASCPAPSAPRARRQLDRVPLVRVRTLHAACSSALRASSRLLGVAASTDPQADRDRLVAQVVRDRRRMSSQAADQQRGALELLDREQPQRVPHEHRHARRRRSREPPEEDVKPISPRYASVLPPPVGNQSRSATSRRSSAGLATPRDRAG